MATVLVFMAVMLGVSAAVAATVVMGMEGHGKNRAPELTDRMARAARHLNGDARPPKRFEHLFH